MPRKIGACVGAIHDGHRLVVHSEIPVLLVLEKAASFSLPRLLWRRFSSCDRANARAVHARAHKGRSDHVDSGRVADFYGRSHFRRSALSDDTLSALALEDRRVVPGLPCHVRRHQCFTDGRVPGRMWPSVLRLLVGGCWRCRSQKVRGLALADDTQMAVT